jgi:hypothetical protein
MQTTKTLPLVEMENLLQSDFSGSYRRGLLDQLAHYRQQLTQLMAATQTVDQTKVLTELKTALQHAETILIQ